MSVLGNRSVVSQTWITLKPCALTGDAIGHSSSPPTASATRASLGNSLEFIDFTPLRAG